MSHVRTVTTNAEVWLCHYYGFQCRVKYPKHWMFTTAENDHEKENNCATAFFPSRWPIDKAGTMIDLNKLRPPYPITYWNWREETIGWQCANRDPLYEKSDAEYFGDMITAMNNWMNSAETKTAFKTLYADILSDEKAQDERNRKPLAVTGVYAM